VQLQPDYAAAWSGIADVYTVKGVAGLVRAEDIRSQVSSAVQKALELDKFSPEAHHAAAAYYLFLEWNWAMADAESQRAIELNPQFAETYHLRSYILLAMNRPEDSEKAQQRSTELDPFARPWALGRSYLSVRKYDVAIKELQLRQDAQPKEIWTRFMLAKAYGFKGMFKESVQEIAEGFRLSQNQEAASEVEQLFAKGGAKAVSQWFLERDLARAKKSYVSPVTLAGDYAELGRKKEALTMLETAYRERSPQLIFLQYAPDFDVLHDDPRYRKIVKDMNMSPAY
jgi:tetratricopeptide (TPR) repeat protein